MTRSSDRLQMYVLTAAKLMSSGIDYNRKKTPQSARLSTHKAKSPTRWPTLLTLCQVHPMSLVQYLGYKNSGPF